MKKEEHNKVLGYDVHLSDSIPPDVVRMTTRTEVQYLTRIAALEAETKRLKALINAERERIIAAISALKVRTLYGDAFINSGFNDGLDAAIAVVKENNAE